VRDAAALAAASCEGWPEGEAVRSSAWLVTGP
jgi:hypothetical protein